jgi:RND family efflux transporter MFP subunit
MRSLILFLFIILNAKTALASPTNVRVIKIESAKFYEIVSSTGILNKDQSQDFLVTIPGKISYISKFQNLKKGEKILSIDEDSANSSLEAVKQAKIKAEIDYKNSITLLQEKLISKQNLQSAKTVYSKALLDYENALKQYENMVLIAPFDGVIGSIKQKVGDNVSSGDFLFSIVGQNGSAIINFNLPSSVLGKINTNSKLWIEDENQKLYGKIISLSSYLSKQTGDFLVKIALDNSKGLVHNKYYNGFFEFNNHTGLGVPENCILSSESGNYVYLVSGDLIKKVDIIVACRLNDLVEIISDELKEGDFVVIEGLNKVIPGSQVKIIE